MLQVYKRFSTRRKHQKEPSVSATDTSFKKLINEIKTRNFTVDELNILMHTVGERLAPLANKHISELNKRNLGNRLEDVIAMTYQWNWNYTFPPFKFILLGLIDGNG